MDNLQLSSDSSYSHRKNTRIKKTFKRLDVKVKIAKPSNEQDNEDDDYCTKDHKLPISFQAIRHFEHIKRVDFEDENSNWRMRDKNNKMKTVSVALVLCLNIGVDPPDVMKIHPCSRVECWVDPTTLSAPKALEFIVSNLQKQYERWQPRARYKKSPDPTSDDIKKLCTSLRRNAKEERVLFHYNGHGVPMPTANGEIWVFNKNYTQYIPLSIYDLQIWMGAPSIYVYDCSHAGVIINQFNQFAKQHEEDLQKHTSTTENAERGSDEQYISFRNCIQLAACSENEILPMNPQLPADLFTSCLTTPIKMALKWYTMQQGQGKMVLAPSINGDLIDKIPGQIADRRTMLGELNWIFTAITDTIAWNTLDRDLFQKLFRQDLLVASLFRNFLLAERILKHHDCTPVSSPVLPQCFRHSMWEAWDLAVDLALQQLPDILEKNIPYKQSPFFEEQLTAFQVWLNRASDKRIPPEQLPIVLQVLLSQVHRLRALELLGRFLDSGPWAVHLALGVGIFPYVLKLLQSAAAELKPVLVHIWAKILAVDSMCQVDLYKHNKYFISVLQDVTYPKETRTLAAFVMSSIVNNFKEGQKSALQDSLLSICLVQLNDDDSKFRQWVIICLGLLWQNFAEARWSGARDMAYDKLTDCLCDPVPEVRAASVFALGTFISSVTNRTEEQANNIDRFISTNLLKVAGEDMSPLVRLELVGALQWMVILFESHFVSVFIPEFVEIKKNLRPGSNIALLPQMNAKDIVTSLIWDHNGSRHQTHSLERNFMRRGFSSNSFNNISQSASVSSPSHGSPNIPYGSMFLKLWQGICNLARDPYPKVSEAACLLLEHITNKAEIALITAKEATMIEKYCTSVSLPPSPNTRSSFLGDSPPQREISNNSMICGSAGARKDTIMGRNGVEITLPIKQSQIRRSSNNGSTSEETNNPIKPLVVTNFIPWCISQFARPTRKMFAEDGTYIDKHSEINRARLSRFKRNENIRKIAIDQQSRAMFIRIDTPIVNFKTQFTPYIIKMFPYESSIAVAYRDKVVVRDLNDLSSYDCNPNLHNITSSRFSFDLTKISRVSTMEFINSHDKPMILVGHDNGMIRIWQENIKCEGQRDYKLVSAWMGLPYLSANSSSSKNISGSSTQGMISTWHQRSQHLIVGDHIVNGSCGPMRYLRIWDARTELKISDLPTNAESSLRVLTSGPSEIIAAGYGNGSISLFDKRLHPNECKVRTFREHTAPILTICLRDRAESMISGCSYGKINLFDLRSHQGPSSWKVGSDVTAITVHSAADIIAFGSHSNIKIFGLDGRTHTSLKPYEGLLSSRLGQPSCLAFHPHKINLAAGYLDNTVYVYGSSGLTSKGG